MGVWGSEGLQEGIYVYTQLIHFVVQQKLSQHCKAIILQLKKKKTTVWNSKDFEVKNQSLFISIL